MTSIKISAEGKELLIFYNDSGIIEYVKDVESKKCLMITMKYEGTGYKFKKEKFMIDTNTDQVCDARYVKVEGFNLFIPRLIYIQNENN